MAGDDRTITAHFVADTAGFEEGVQQVEESSKAIASSTEDMGQQFEYTWTSLDKNGKVVQQTMTASSQAAADSAKAFNDVREQELGISDALSTVNDASKETEKATSGLSNSITSVGDASKGTADNTKKASEEIAAVGGASKEAGTNIAAVGGASEETARSTDTLTESTKKTKTATDEAKTSHEGFMQTLQNVQQIIQLVQLVAQFIAAMDKLDEALKNSQTAFTYLTGSADEASKVMSKLNTSFAAQAFGTQPVDNAAQHLMMLGKSADEAQNVIEKVADGLAAMGKDSSNLDAISVSLENMKTESRITTQEMNNLVNQGLPAWDALALGMGKDVATAQREVKDGAVQGSQAFNEMMIGLGQYTGAAAAKTNDLSSEWTRFSQNFAKLMGPVIDTLAKMFEIINEILEGTYDLSQTPLGSAFGSAPGGTFAGMGVGHASGIIDSPIGHFATVGENGPETMFVPKGASIFPNGANPLDALQGGAGTSLASSLNALGDISLAGMTGGISGPLNLYLYFDSQQFAQYFIPQMANTMRAYFGVRR